MGPQIRFEEPVAVDVNLPVPHLHHLVWKAHDPFNEGLGGILRVPEHNHISSFDLTKVVDELVDEDSLLVCQVRLHAGTFDLNRLDNENHNQDGCQRRKKDVSSPDPQLTKNIGLSGVLARMGILRDSRPADFRPRCSIILVIHNDVEE